MGSTAFDLLDETARSNFLRLLMQSFHCTYVCFWSYVPSPTNFSCIGFGSCLRFQDGVYCEEFNTQLPSSSSGSLALRLFHEYRQSIFTMNAENNHVPGCAFRNSFPYLEFEEFELRRLASNETQRQFYKEARIKTAVFVGCKAGEIELGLSNVPTINTKMEIQSLFLPEDFPTSVNPIPTDHQNPHYSSSSSSLRSLSNIDSPEYSSLLFNIPSTSTTSTSQAQEILSHAQAINRPSLQLQRPISMPPSIIPHQQAMQAFARLRNPNFPSQEAEEETITKAILAVLTSSTPPLYSSSSASAFSPSSSSTYSHPLINPNSAFKNYASGLSASPLDHLGLKKSMLKRSIQFFRGLNLLRNRQTLQMPRPSSTQLHHMMSERKRREKLNESFHALRSLLPPGTKKDKASLLNTTKEYLASLKAQIEELSRRNKQLEAQIFPSSAANKEANNTNNSTNIGEESEPYSSGDQRAIDVRVRNVSESASEDQAMIVDLQVILRAPIPAEDLVLRILEFLKRVENVSLMSLQANTSDLTESTTPINRVILRLRVREGSEWDESAFQEAVRRVVADLAQ